MKLCPFCAEQIQDAAVVCKHCSRDLVGGRAPAPIPVVVKMGPVRKTLLLGCLGFWLIATLALMVPTCVAFRTRHAQDLTHQDHLNLTRVATE